MTKKALISPNETNIEYISEYTLVNEKYEPIIISIPNAQRVSEVVELGKEFEVSSPLYWKDCEDNVTWRFYLDTVTDTLKPIPENAVDPNQTIVNGVSIV